MEWSTVLLIALGVLVVLLFSGMRVFAVLYLVGAIMISLLMGVRQTELFGILTWTTAESLTLAAMPLFIFMGAVFHEGKIGERIYAAMQPLADRIPGGLLQTNIVVGTFLAASTGSSFASAATIGTIALPEMEKRNYAHSIAMGSIAAGGSLGILIPPSTPMIIYALMVDESIGKLFIAGVLPGIMLASLYMAYIIIRVVKNPSLAPRGAVAPLVASVISFLRAWPIILLIIFVLGSIYGGIATPTEAAAVGCVGVTVMAIAFRGFSWRVVKAATAHTLRTTCQLMLLYMGARVMGLLLANTGVLHQLAQWIIALPVPPVGILAAIIVMYLILGCFISGLPSIVITLPITFPIVVSLGYDPIWFLVITVLLNEAGFMTPPVGLLLYFVHGLRPEMPFSETMKGVAPFVICLVVAIAILIAFPQIATFLPGVMLGR